MKRLQKFDDFSINEYYDPNKHKALNLSREIFKKPGVKKFLHIMSILDDIVHLDFKNIRNTYKNKEGYQKISDAIAELGLAVKALDGEDGSTELTLFYDIQKYGIDVDGILDCLEDESVKKYLEGDKRGKAKLDQFQNTIDLLKRYRDWNNGELKM